MRRIRGKATRYPGVELIDAKTKTYRVRAKVTNPRTGRKKEIDRVLTGLTSPIEASVKRTELVRQASSEHEDPARTKTVSEFARSWLVTRLASKQNFDPTTTGRLYGIALDTHILPALGRLRVGDVRHDDVQEWVTSLTTKAKLAPRTVRFQFAVLRALMRKARRIDPCVDIELPAIEEEDGDNQLSGADLGRALTALQERTPEYYALVMTLAATGLRFCHVSALRWEDHDAEKEQLLVKLRHYQGGVGPVGKRKKAPKVIPIPSKLEAILVAHRQRLMATQPLGVASGWIFPDADREGPQRRDRVAAAWAKAQTLAGVSKPCKLHGIRRTWIDLTRRAEIDPVTIRSMAGHSTEAMREHYSTVSLAEKERAMGAVLRQVGTEVGTGRRERRKAK